MSPHFGMVQEALVRSVYARQRHACAREAPQDSSLGGTVRVGVFRGKGGICYSSGRALILVAQVHDLSLMQRPLQLGAHEVGNVLS